MLRQELAGRIAPHLLETSHLLEKKDYFLECNKVERRVW